MNAKLQKRILILFFALFSLLLSGTFLGLENLRFSEIDWLLGSGDISNAQNGWTFFKNDKWHFPLGKNPNYGLEISNSIIFTDSIPLLAFLFKIFKNFLSINFQYFSFWIFICFFFQFYFSYLIIYRNTNSIYYSLISSIIFVTSPIFIYRLGIHLSLGAQWLILFAYYINFYVEKKIKKYFWVLILILSTLIHLYFTAMLFLIYTSILVGEFFENKKIIKPLITLLTSLIIVLLFMFIFGYFEGNLFGTISRGYGKFGLDLLGIFDPQINEGNLNWSFFLKDITGTSVEGFNYLGLGCIVLLAISIIIYLFKVVKNKYYLIESFKYNLSYLLIIFFSSCWAITTNIYFKGEEILIVPIHNYILGVLSIFAATGRFFWPVYYLLIILSLFYIFNNFSKKYAQLIITIILLIQIVDINPGLNNYFLYKKHISKPKIFNSKIWKKIPNDYEKIRTTYYYHNYGPLFASLNHFLGTSNIKKTDIILNTSLSRVKAAKVRYDFNNALYNKTLPSDTAYVVDNLGHLKQMKIFLKNTNDGFFYRDNIWLVLPNKKIDMSDDDLDRISKIELDTIEANKKYQFNFLERQKLLGVGWSHNSGNEGVWSEGSISFILFNLPKPISGKLSLNFNSYKGNKNDNFEVKIYFNNTLKKTIKLNNLNVEENATFDFEENEIKNENIIMFEFDNLISPFDIFESPDARKIGILLKSMTVETN